LSDPIEDAYEKYLRPDEPTRDLDAEIMARESDAPCPRCGSEDVDRSRGYRGEYICRSCGHEWQVGGKDARS